MTANWNSRTETELNEAELAKVTGGTVALLPIKEHATTLK